jgi:hypothetical protein
MALSVSSDLLLVLTTGSIEWTRARIEENCWLLMITCQHSRTVDVTQD